jgi:hypothetical protein
LLDPNHLPGAPVQDQATKTRANAGCAHGIRQAATGSDDVVGDALNSQRLGRATAQPSMRAIAPTCQRPTPHAGRGWH